MRLTANVCYMIIIYQFTILIKLFCSFWTQISIYHLFYIKIIFNKVNKNRHFIIATNIHQSQFKYQFLFLQLFSEFPIEINYYYDEKTIEFLYYFLRFIFYILNLNRSRCPQLNMLLNIIVNYWNSGCC